jgi:hypothetical protein
LKKNNAKRTYFINRPSIIQRRCVRALFNLITNVVSSFSFWLCYLIGDDPNEKLPMRRREKMREEDGSRKEREKDGIRKEWE